MKFGVTLTALPKNPIPRVSPIIKSSTVKTLPCCILEERRVITWLCFDFLTCDDELVGSWCSRVEMSGTKSLKLFNIQIHNTHNYIIISLARTNLAARWLVKSFHRIKLGNRHAKSLRNYSSSITAITLNYFLVYKPITLIPSDKLIILLLVLGLAVHKR